ncbi:hypothetical protein GCM10009802_21620 [Streptomyces synnematoformans]|uniref:Uncharacterized protein n=1 Tax=Streptomyces synnematoformans TaxID=415721 RepID=A0ABN2XZC7_9ACTN
MTERNRERVAAGFLRIVCGVFAIASLAVATVLLPGARSVGLAPLGVFALCGISWLWLTLRR